VTCETLLVTVADGVRLGDLNRPEVRNALNATMIGELEQALSALEADPEARVIVLAGAGDRAFRAGADLKGMASAARRCRRASPSGGSRASSRPWRA